jgi:hypothetical protein
MTPPSRITDESVFVRWMGLESAKKNEGLVKQRKSFAILLAEKDPVSITKKGDTSDFDPSMIADWEKPCKKTCRSSSGSRTRSSLETPVKTT